MVDKITKTMSLDLSKVPSNRKSQLKKEIGEFVVGEILRSLSDGKSPVKGYGNFKQLSKEYADEKKGGNRNPNLELEGDMLDALESKNLRGDKIEIGIFRKSQVPKADGHNNFSGDSKLPLRRYIPKQGEEFDREIQSGIKRIIKSAESFTVDESDVESLQSDTTSLNISIESLLQATGGDNVFSGGDALIGRLFGNDNNES